ncbi:MAG: hypothetical protein AAF573_22910 [Bacteroidota bacterium]
MEDVQLMEQQKVSSKKKPKWLKILEKQSWQAELVISGLAIFGSLQLPAIVNALIDFALFNFSEQYMYLLMYFFVYLLLASNILIVSFIAHFALRTLWIGLLGLVSVYPDGINASYERFSKDYMQKLLRAFPDINDFNKRLDDLCSIIFATTGAAVITMTMISITVGALIVIATLVHKILPFVSVQNTFLFILALLLFYSLFVSALSNKKLKEKEWVKRIQFPLTQWMGKVIYNIAYEPITYIQMTLLTNSKRSKYIVGNVLIFAVSMISVFVNMFQSNIGYFPSDNFFYYRTNTAYLSNVNYENLNTKKISHIAPMIQSDVIEDGAIRLFIPFLERERIYMNEICGEYQNSEDLSGRPLRRAKAKFEVACCNKYYDIYLNDTKLDDLTYYQHDHSNNGESGFLTYIPTENCQSFQNVLKVKSHYKYDEESREMIIPFIFNPQK